ncbi:hypothetical protein ONZ45_g8353 [Pleurotus djamor]|nr:hypothetical protein ONZ45_g8353 [Pleurotus djamor]
MDKAHTYGEKGRDNIEIAADVHSIDSAHDSSHSGYFSGLSEKLRGWGVETRGIQPVPPHERTDTQYHKIFFIWMSSNFNIFSFSIGALAPSYGVGLRDACISILLFNLLCCIPPAYICTWGSGLGLRQMVQGRYSFGFYGITAPCILNIMQIVGYTAVCCIVGGQTLSAVSDNSLGSNLGITVIGLASLVLCFLGYGVLSCLIMLGVGGKHLGGPEVNVPATNIPAIFSFGALVGPVIAWSTYCSDLTCYYPPDAPRKRIFIYSYLGLFLSTATMQFFGAACAIAALRVPAWEQGFEGANIGGLISAILAPTGAFGKCLVVLLALGLTATIAMNFYCFCLNVQVFIPKLLLVPRYVFSVIATGIVIPVAIVGSRSFADTLSNLVGIIGYWAAPFVAIILTEHVVFRRAKFENYDISAWDKPHRLPAGIAALIAGAIATTMAVLSMNQAWYTGPIAHFTGDIGLEIGFGTALLLYPPLRMLEIRFWGDIPMP